MSDKNIDDWIFRLDCVTDAVEQECSLFQQDILEARPQPESWSAAEVIEHIVAVNTSYFPLFDALISGTYRVPWIAHIGFVPGMFGRMILNSVRPENKRKTSTLRIWQPVPGAHEAQIASQFRQHQNTLKEYLKALEPFLERNMIINSPANRNIVYPLSTALEIVVTHEERHLDQFKRALAGVPN